MHGARHGGVAGVIYASGARVRVDRGAPGRRVIENKHSTDIGA
jgi:hypothetical protein